MNTESTSLYHHLNDPGRLAALRAVALLDTPCEEAFDRLSRLAAQFTKAPVALVSLVDSDRQFFKSCVGLPEPWNSRRETPLTHSFCQHNRSADVPLIITDARTHPLFRDNQAIHDLSVIAYLGIPLVSPDSHILGSFCVIDTQPRSWTQQEVEAVTDLAAAVMTEIHLRAEIAQRQKAEGDRDELAALHTSLQDETKARQLAEADLKEVLLRQNEVLRSANVGLWDWDINTGKVLYSIEWKKQIGYETHEIGNDFNEWQSRVHPEDLALALNKIQHSLADPAQPYEAEFRILHKDGSYRWILAQASALPDGMGRPARMIGVHIDITERKKIETALYLSKGRYQVLFEHAPYGIVIADDKSYYIDANARMCRMLGYTRDEMIGMHASDIIAETEIQHVEPTLREIKTQSGHFRVWQFRRKDGSLFDAEVSATMLPDGYLLGIIRDITKIRQAEDRLVHERNLSNQIINSMPGVIYLFNGEGRFLRWNINFGEAIGYTDDEISHLHPVELFRGPDRDRIAERIQKVFETGHADIEAELVAKEGQTTPYFFTGRRIIYEGQTCVISMGINIIELKSTEDALRESEKRFRDLVRLLPVTVFETDPNYQLTFVNQHAHELFGYSEKDLEKGINSLDLIDPKDHSRAMTNMAKWLKGDNPGTTEYQAIKKDGTSFPILLLATSMIKTGHFSGLRGIIIDISDRKQQEEERLKISDQLRQAQKMESIGRLAGGVSHDLNNMLSPIIGYTELLLYEFEKNENIREQLNHILGAGLRAKDMVHQLLAFSRKQTLEYKPIHLNKILTNFENLLRRTIREDIEIEILTSPVDPVIMADTGQLEQVVMNLAVNAQDAMPNGGKLVFETGTACLEEAYTRIHPGSKPGHYALLTASDSGMGMDEETREHLFEPFFSTKGDKGTGLGLATVFGIIKQHQGNIWVYSEPGMGSTFKIYLPLPQKVHSKIDSTPKARLNLKGSETILIAEDNEYVRLLVHDILKKQGYTILLAENGTEALKVLNGYGRPVHLLLTDVVMPEMNGKGLCSLALEKFPDLKVLFMSGYTDEIISHHGVLEKGVQLIHKPISADILSSRVREILDKK